MSQQVYFLLAMVVLIGIGVLAMSISIKRYNARMASMKKKRKFRK
jgi:hypothetical protein